MSIGDNILAVDSSIEGVAVYFENSNKLSRIPETGPRSRKVSDSVVISSKLFSQLLEIDTEFFAQSGFHCLRPEAKILIALQEYGKMSVKELISHSGMSYRGFYVVLNRLYELGLVANTADSNDKRVRRLSLVRQFSFDMPETRSRKRAAGARR